MNHLGAIIDRIDAINTTLLSIVIALGVLVTGAITTVARSASAELRAEVAAIRAPAPLELKVIDQGPTEVCRGDLLEFAVRVKSFATHPLHIDIHSTWETIEGGVGGDGETYAAGRTVYSETASTNHMRPVERVVDSWLTVPDALPYGPAVLEVVAVMVYYESTGYEVFFEVVPCPS